MEKYKIAIFDLDGTILNTIEDLADSTNYALACNNLPQRSLEEIKSFVGNGIRKLIERAVLPDTDKEVVDKVHQSFTEHYKVHCADKTRPYEGINDVIIQLREKGIKTAVVSNKADYGVQLLCQDYFDGLFDYAVGEKEGNRRKPYPDAVYEVLDKFGIDKEDAVYIGDSEVDYQTSRNAGIDVIMVGWGFRKAAYLLEIGAKFVISNPNEILNYFVSDVKDTIRTENDEHNGNTSEIKVMACASEDVEKARYISQKLNAPMINGLNNKQTDTGLVLKVAKEGLTLTDGVLTINGDFSKMIQRVKPGNLQKEILIKAVRIKGKDRINVIDATAGMGDDSLILAAAGFNVIMYEQDKIIATLLESAVEHAKEIEELKDIVTRMQVNCEDSIRAMRNLNERPDVILLDPMFPERQKSAMVKKKFQLLGQLEKPCNNEEELMQAAIDAKPRKIVVKRPAKGPYLAGKKPSHSIGGKAVRYDCYIM